MREGSVSRAAEVLRLAQPTVSTQIKQFERALGESLLERQGRRVVATEVGRLVYRYADEIFLLGRELQETLKGRPTGGAMRLRVGVANAVPKLIVFQMLRPAMESATGIQVSCSEGQPDHLLAQLAVHALDVVISDVPASPHLRVKVFSICSASRARPSLPCRHWHGGCGVAIRSRCSTCRCSCQAQPARCGDHSSSGSSPSACGHRLAASSTTRP